MEANPWWMNGNGVNDKNVVLKLEEHDAKLNLTHNKVSIVKSSLSRPRGLTGSRGKLRGR